jgi:hypothetical protein
MDIDETTYLLHQTPVLLAKRIIDNIEWEVGECVVEPFKGEGAFYNQLPSNVIKSYAEIREGIDFKDINYDNIDTVISNPPFRLNGKNAFSQLVLYFAKTKIKRLIFLCSSACYNSLTPTRMHDINSCGLYINKVTTCSVKKWYGRYFVIEFGRERNIFFNYFLENFD